MSDSSTNGAGAREARPDERPEAAPEGVHASVRRRTGRPSQVSLRPESGGGDPVIDPRGAAHDLVPPGRGHYRVLGEIARGGMGVVMRAHDADLGRDVALKVLHEHLAGDPAVVERFVEEAQIGGQLQHPGIVSVYELGLMADERPYFTMKLVKGRTLAALLADRDDPADERHRFVGLFERICQTIAYAHSRGVIHRDLKPSNVMVGAFGELQVVDWGLAKVMARGGVEDELRAPRAEVSSIATVRSGPGSRASQVGSVLGTPAYMAPEQARGELEGLDERADVFSLGAILAEILTGRAPYEGDDLVEQAAAARLGPLRERLAACGADPELVALAERCLARAPAARPRNAGRLADAVRDHLTAAEERARAAQVAAAEASARAEQERRARLLAVALAASVLVTALVGGGSYAWFRAERDRQAAEVNAILLEASARRGRGDLEGALREAEKAEALVATGAPAELERAVRELADDVGAEAARAREAEHEHQRRERLRDRLAEVLERTELGTLSGEALARLDGRICDALGEYGLDLDDDAGAERAIAASGMAQEIAQAIDELSRTRRLRLEPDVVRSADGLSRLAMRVDPDPQRNELRSAVVEGRFDDLSALATPANAGSWPPATSTLLVLSLRDSGRFDDRAARFVHAAVRAHPDHFQLQLGAGIQLTLAGRTGEALRHLQAARALNPRSMVALARLFHAYWTECELAASEQAWRDALALDPSHASVPAMRERQISAYLATGEPERAWSLYDEQPEDARSPRGLYYNDAAWLLVEAPFAAPGDVERGLELAARAAELRHSDPLVLNTLAAAEYRAGRYERALETLAHVERMVGFADAGDLAFRAMALARLGRADEAHATLAELSDRMARAQEPPADLRRLWEEARTVVGP